MSNVSDNSFNVQRYSRRWRRIFRGRCYCEYVLRRTGELSQHRHRRRSHRHHFRHVRIMPILSQLSFALIGIKFRRQLGSSLLSTPSQNNFVSRLVMSTSLRIIFCEHSMCYFPFFFIQCFETVGWAVYRLCVGWDVNLGRQLTRRIYADIVEIIMDWFRYSPSTTRQSRSDNSISPASAHTELLTIEFKPANKVGFFRRIRV